MGFKRFLKKTLIPGYDVFDTMKKIAENGVVDGVKEKLKEDVLEDMPLTSHIYNAGKNEGKYEGKREGYAQASTEYKKKLLDQAEKFLKQIKDIEIQKAEYEKLLDDCEKYIVELEKKINLSEQEKNDMNEIIVLERKLRNLK